MQDLVGIQFLSRGQVEILHAEMLELAGGMAGTRDDNMVDSAINAPKAMAFGLFLHKSIHHMAAALLFGLANNHGFVDGNKRTAAHATNTFYLMNGYRPVMEQDELVDFVVKAVTDKPSIDSIAVFLESKALKSRVAEG